MVFQREMIFSELIGLSLPALLRRGSIFPMGISSLSLDWTGSWRKTLWVPNRTSAWGLLAKETEAATTWFRSAIGSPRSPGQFPESVFRLGGAQASSQKEAFVTAFGNTAVDRGRMLY